MKISIKGYDAVENFGRTGVDEIAEIEVTPKKGDFFLMEIDNGADVKPVFHVNGYEMGAILKALGFLDNMVHVNAKVEVKKTKK